MATWNSRDLRGSTLEELINITNELYREKKLGLVQKIPTPITPVKIDKASGQISLAYFEKDSTVDYIGVVQGVPICFDAKECALDTYSLRNIHEHQIAFMRFSELKYSLERVKEGHAKNFKYDELNPKYFIRQESGAPVHYLRGLQIDLQERQG